MAGRSRLRRVFCWRLPVKSITSKDNPTFRELLDLAANRPHRRRRGQTLLDGEHLLDAALQAGCRPQLIALSETALAGPLASWSDRLANVPCVVLGEGLFKRLSPVETPTGLLAVIEVPAASARKHDCALLLEDIRDPGNLGAILRVAAAAACRQVYLSKGCAEAWSPKCLRGGQGAHFLLSIQEEADLPGVVRDLDIPVHAAALVATSSLYELDLRGRMAFAFGNEGAGLTPQLLAAARPFSIPMPGGMESLNVATAAAVCLFERVRQLG